MRILLLNQFCLPDIAPTGKYLHDFARTLKSRGHDVLVLCSTAPYSEKLALEESELIDGVSINRVWATGFGRNFKAGRIADYFTFLASLSFKMLTLQPRPDVVVSLTTPPFLGLVSGAIASLNNSMMSHWVMDLYPDVLAAHRMLGSENPLYRVLQAFTRSQMRAPLTFCIGNHMQALISRYFDAAMLPSLKCIPLWAPEYAVLEDCGSNYRDFRVRNGWNEDERVFMYSGNMGSGHRFGEFLSASQQLGRNGPRWVYIGAGERRKEIEDFARQMPDVKLSLLPYAKPGLHLEHLRAADVHLISQSAEWQGAIVPSKTQGIFSVGRPAIFVGAARNEVADWITESGGGWVVPENDLNALLRACDEAMDPVESGRRGIAAKKYAETRFNYAINSTNMAEMLEQAFETFRISR